MKNQLIKNAFILGVSGIFAKSFDFLFRVFYSRSLGAEGMGLLSLGFGIHGVMLTVSTAGLGVAVSKIVSEYFAKKDTGAVLKSMQFAVFGVITLSLSVILFTFLFAEWISVKILGEPRVASSLCALVPSIFFMGVSYCLKGYFYAKRTVIIPASSEFLEQLVKGISITLLLHFFLPKGISYGCTAVFAGITIGEMSSCLYLTLFFFRDMRNLKNSTQEEGIGQEIFKVAFPAMLTSLTGSFLRMQEEVWIVSALKDFGMSHSVAVSNLGILSGMVMPMLVFPLTLLGSVTTLLIPEISRLSASNEKRRANRMIRIIYSSGILLGSGILLIFQLFAEEISQLLYHETAMAPMVQRLSFLLPFMFLDSFSCAILNGFGKQVSMLFYSLSDSILRLLGIHCLVSRFGMYGMEGVIIFSNFYTCYLTVRKVFLQTKGEEFKYFWSGRRKIKNSCT